MTQTIVDALRLAWQNFLDGIAAFVPGLLAMLSIVVVGWLIAAVLAYVTRRLLGWLRFNALAERTGGAEMLKKVELPPAETLAGSVMFWLVWLGFLMAGMSALGLTAFSDLFTGFVHYIPRLVLALVILVVGLVAANFAWRATLLATVNAQMPSARLLSSAVRFLIVVLTVTMALEQIAVARTVILTAFAIAFGAVMLGIAIAFGIGGSNVARRVLEEQFPEQKPKDPDGLSHL
jgi:hypothetical protein